MQQVSQAQSTAAARPRRSNAARLRWLAQHWRWPFYRRLRRSLARELERRGIEPREQLIDRALESLLRDIRVISVRDMATRPCGTPPT